eukprot:GHVQ01037026.1.p1 GENE.GHVQ01037026.1~~GHVQ01037026.1.p1  ORF type:complete len:665 (+),score=99.92 GHVQ01037026.1:113-1996(+)
MKPIIKDYFDLYKHKTQPIITKDGYSEFLKNIQGISDPHMLESESQLFDQLRGPLLEQRGLNVVGFSCLLSSEPNSLMRPEKKLCYQDMDRPLSEYWIASSHNTYLTGDQVIGRSAVGQYIDVLLRGCRCVEIDCWDGTDGDPIVYHGLRGYALSGRIPFESIIQACKDYGFQHSDYPILLSLEMHCSVKQKIRTGEIIRQVLGDQLYTYNVGCTPTPNNCKNKFIIKGKVPDESGETEIDEGNEDDLELEEMENSLSQVIADPSAAAEDRPRMRKSYSSDNLSKNTKRKEKTNLRTGRTKVYYNCVSLSGRQLKNFGDPRKALDICSMNETKFLKVQKNQSEELLRFTATYLCRIYPAGLRLTSTNFNPMPMWFCGAQIVALNCQAVDIPTIINQGRFIENGGKESGYVLKPAILLGQGEDRRGYDKDRLSYDEQTVVEQGVNLTVQIISAHELPRPASLSSRRRKTHSPQSVTVAAVAAVHAAATSPTALLRGSVGGGGGGGGNSFERDPCCPFVCVSVFDGVRTDTNVSSSVSSTTCRTPPVMFNGFNPSWRNGDQIFRFKVYSPALAILVFEVRHGDTARSDMLAAGALPVSCVRPGLRWLSLFDSRFREVNGCGLMLRVSME